jgi:hypothetical protein
MSSAKVQGVRPADVSITRHCILPKTIEELHGSPGVQTISLRPFRLAAPRSLSQHSASAPEALYPGYGFGKRYGFSRLAGNCMSTPSP